MNNFSRRGLALFGAGAAVSVLASAAHGAPRLPGPRAGLLTGRAPKPANLVGRTWTSPFAAAQPTEQGRRIRNMVAHDGKLYLGYGDYSGNTGPIELHYIDTGTGEMSGSVFTLPFEDNTAMKILDGAIYAPNMDPESYWEGGQPFATNTSGAWELSGWTNAVHVFDIETVPGIPGALMAAGAWLHGVTGAASYATWLTLDGGRTWKAFMDLAKTTTPYRIYRLGSLDAELYASTPDGLWRWRGVVPPGEWNSFESGWERTSIPGFDYYVYGEFARANNERFYAWTVGVHTWPSAFLLVFDGTSGTNLYGELTGVRDLFTDHATGWVYGITQGVIANDGSGSGPTYGGIVRSKDGVRWFKHPAPRDIWEAPDVLASSLAVVGTTIFVAGAGSFVRAVSGTKVAWVPAITVNDSDG